MNNLKKFLIITTILATASLLSFIIPNGSREVLPIAATQTPELLGPVTITPESCQPPIMDLADDRNWQQYRKGYAIDERQKTDEGFRLVSVPDVFTSFPSVRFYIISPDGEVLDTKASLPLFLGLNEWGPDDDDRPEVNTFIFICDDGQIWIFGTTIPLPEIVPPTPSRGQQASLERESNSLAFFWPQIRPHRSRHRHTN